MSLATTYLGLHLKNPVITGSAPFADDLDVVRRLEDAGVAAITLRSLFEEQVVGEQLADIYHREIYADAAVEASGYLPDDADAPAGPDHYLEHIGRLKRRLSIPVIASLNGTTVSGWVEYAGRIQQAGADALELNCYYLPTSPAESSSDVEGRLVDLVKAVREVTTLPLAVKLSPFFSALPNLANRLDEAGVKGLVLFNRFYQPEINIEELSINPTLHLSDPSELLLRLRWAAILYSHVRCSIAVSGGVDSARGTVQSLMAGAAVVQVVSGIMKRGPSVVRHILTDLETWMHVHEYQAVREMRGSMSLARCPDPGAFERANYMRVLHSYKLPGAVATWKG